eukprot:g22156.t1
MVSSMSFGLPKRKKAAPLATPSGAIAGGSAAVPVPDNEPDWDRLDGLVMLIIDDRQELIEVDPELGPKVYNATGESSFFSLKNLVSNSTLEVPQKQWKDPFDLARSAINPNTSAVPDEDYTSSERKVACYMAAKRNKYFRASGGQQSVEELLAKQEAAKKEEEELIKQLEERCEVERRKPPVVWTFIGLEVVSENHKKKSAGLFYGLEFPWTAQMLGEFGAKWLTEAFHRAGTLERTNRVTSLKIEDTKVTGGNNAGKFLLSVKYAKEREGLHTKLFAKIPHQMTKDTKQDRLSSSVLKQPMDFCEINTYRLVETKLPTPTPKKKGQIKPFEVEGPYDKCKDYELNGDPKEYYTLIMEVESSGSAAGVCLSVDGKKCRDGCNSSKQTL